jgi:sulfatase modifying factor 1
VNALQNILRGKEPFIFAPAVLLALIAGCPHEAAKPVPPAEAPRFVSTSLDAQSDADSGATADKHADATAVLAESPIDASADAEALHRASKEELLAFFPIVAKTDRERASAESLLSYWVGSAVGKINQGNKAIARHAIGKRTCIEGLRGLLQTDEQRARCGADNMVPIWKNGDPQSAAYCIDQFEFPGQPCELPMVWVTPTQAQKVCQIAGKRLCTQEEWTLACKGDPEGKKDQTYAYGETLDLNVCNTNKPHPFGPDGRNWICYVHDAESAFKTCETDTEPGGAFPKCRSRFGVFDQHGNVAEIMTRGAFTQLKGSAFFYVDVAREKGAPQPKDNPHDTYPDHCAYDPRWHVEMMDNALHVNYHLGFRCCKSIDVVDTIRR